jgi:hypothetical protein
MFTMKKWPRDPARDYAHLFASNDPKLIAETLKRFTESSQCHDGSPHDRAVAILSDHLVHDAAVLSTRQKKMLDEVKDWLRDLFTVRG